MQNKENNDQQKDALHIAAKEGNLELVKTLLKDIDINIPHSEDGSFPLSWACQSNNTDLIQYFLENNAHIYPGEFCDAPLFLSQNLDTPLKNIVVTKTLTIYNQFLKNEIVLKPSQQFGIIKSLFYTFKSDYYFKSLLMTAEIVLAELVKATNHRQLSFVVMSLIDVHAIIIKSNSLEKFVEYYSQVLALFDIFDLKAAKQMIGFLCCNFHLIIEDYTTALSYCQRIEDETKLEKTYYYFTELYIREMANNLSRNINAGNDRFFAITKVIYRFLIKLCEAAPDITDTLLLHYILSDYLVYHRKLDFSELLKIITKYESNLDSVSSRLEFTFEHKFLAYKTLLSGYKTISNQMSIIDFNKKIKKFLNKLEGLITSEPDLNLSELKMIYQAMSEGYSGFDNKKALTYASRLLNFNYKEEDEDQAVLIGISMAELYLAENDVKSAIEIFEKSVDLDIKKNLFAMEKYKDQDINFSRLDKMASILYDFQRPGDHSLVELKIKIFYFYLEFKIWIGTALFQKNPEKALLFYNVYEKLYKKIISLPYDSDLPSSLTRKVFWSNEDLIMHALKHMLYFAIYAAPDPFLGECLSAAKEDSGLFISLDVKHIKEKFQFLKTNRLKSRGLENILLNKRAYEIKDKMDLFDHKVTLAILEHYLDEEHYSLASVNKSILALKDLPWDSSEYKEISTTLKSLNDNLVEVGRFERLSRAIKDYFVNHAMNQYDNSRIFLEIYLIFFKVFYDISLKSPVKNMRALYKHLHVRLLPDICSDNPTSDEIEKSFQQLNDVRYTASYMLYQRQMLTMIPKTDFEGCLSVKEGMTNLFDILFTHMSYFVYDTYGALDRLPKEVISNMSNIEAALCSAIKSILFPATKQIVFPKANLEESSIEANENNENKKNQKENKITQNHLQKLFDDLKIQVEIVEEGENFKISFGQKKDGEIVKKYFLKKGWVKEDQSKEEEMVIGGTATTESALLKAYFPLCELANKIEIYQPPKKKSDASHQTSSDSNQQPEKPAISEAKLKHLLAKSSGKQLEIKGGKEENKESKYSPSKKNSKVALKKIAKPSKTKKIPENQTISTETDRAEDSVAVKSIQVSVQKPVDPNNCKLEFYFFAKNRENEQENINQSSKAKENEQESLVDESFLQYAFHHGLRLRNLYHEIVEKKIYEVDTVFVWRATIYNFIRMFNAVYLSQDTWINLLLPLELARDYRNILADRCDYFLCKVSSNTHQAMISEKKESLYHGIDEITVLIESKRKNKDIHNIRSKAEFFEKQYIYKRFLTSERKPNHLDLTKPAELKDPIFCLKLIIEEIGIAHQFMAKIVTSDEKISSVDRMDAARMSLIFIGDIARCLRDECEDFCKKYLLSDLHETDYSSAIRRLVNSKKRGKVSLLTALKKLNPVQIEKLIDLITLNEYLELCISVRNTLGHNHGDIELNYKSIYQAEEISEHLCSDLIHLSWKKRSYIEEVVSKYEKDQRLKPYSIP